MEQDTLKALYRDCDPDEPIAADDPRNVDFDDAPEDERPRGEGWAGRVHRTIVRSFEPTCTLLSGPPGCGKSTELRRLDAMLAADGWLCVGVDAGEFIERAEPIDSLAVLGGVVLHAKRGVLIARGEDPQKAERTSYGDRLWRWLTATNVDLSPAPYPPFVGVSLSPAPAPERRELMNDLLRVFDELASDARRFGHAGLVLLVDSLDSLHGSSANWSEVLLSAETFFRDLPKVRLPVHVVFTVPPALYTRNVSGIELLPQIRLQERHTRAPFDPGFTCLRELVRRRVSDVQLSALLGPTFEARIREAIEWSAGVPRELLRILRQILTAAEFPVSNAGWRSIKSETFAPFAPLVYTDDLQLLARIHTEGYLRLDDGRKLDTLARMLETNLLGHYRDPDPWFDVHPAVLELPHFQSTLASLRSSDESPAPTIVTEAAPAVRVEQIELESIRCFERLSLSLASDKEPANWTLLLGDNAHGKSTLLRAIALGLCLESEAAALLEAIPGQLLRYGANEGRIALTLVDDSGERYYSDTHITADEGRERLRRTRWTLSTAQVFVCGYGTNRTRTADHSHAGYNRYDAVRSLFDDHTSLQNPELVLRRQDDATRRRVERKLLEVLMLDPNRAEITYSSTRGLEIRGPWANGDWIAGGLQTLSDGYRSTAQWVIDLVGWLVHASRFVRDEDIAGIVLIDELEQHLHPRWQRYIIKLLEEQFPSLQFIASTHTPLVTLGLADREHGLLVQLAKESERGPGVSLVDPHELRGLRADQVLTSNKGFGLATSRSPESASRIARYTELMSLDQPSQAELQELAELRAELRETLVAGETPYERRVEVAVRDALERLSAEPMDETVEFELSRQLRELFDPEST